MTAYRFPPVDGCPACGYQQEEKKDGKELKEDLEPDDVYCEDLLRVRLELELIRTAFVEQGQRLARIEEWWAELDRTSRKLR